MIYANVTPPASLRRWSIGFVLCIGMSAGLVFSMPAQVASNGQPAHGKATAHDKLGAPCHADDNASSSIASSK